MGVMTNAFLAQVDAFVAQHNIPVVQFRKGQRKDDVAAEYRARFQGNEGILFLGKAQEKVTVFRTEKRTGADGKKYGQRVDYEYERNGTASIFMFGEPLSGFRQATARARRTKEDWAIEVAQLLDGVMPAARK
jgi:hypothetical protein